MYIIFDQFGNPYEVEHMEEMTNEMIDQEIEELYKSSSYFLLYTEKLYHLNDSGEIKLPNKKFELAQISDAIDIMGKKIDTKLGKDIRECWDQEVQEQWIENNVR